MGRKKLIELEGEENEVEEIEEEKPKKHKKPQEVADVLAKISEENLDNLYTTLKELEYEDAKINLFRMNLQKKFAFLNAFSPFEFSLDSIKANYGAGTYRINIKAGSVPLKSITFHIDEDVRRDEGNLQSASLLNEMERLRQKIDELEKGKYNLEQYEKMTNLAKEGAVKDAYIEGLTKKIDELTQRMNETASLVASRPDNMKEILVELLKTKNTEIGATKVDNLKSETKDTINLIQNQIQQMNAQFNQTLQMLLQRIDGRKDDDEVFMRKMASYKAMFDKPDEKNFLAQMVDLFARGLEIGRQTITETEPEDFTTLVAKQLLPQFMDVVKQYAEKTKPTTPSDIPTPQVSLPTSSVQQPKSPQPKPVVADTISQTQEETAVTLTQLAFKILEYAKANKNKIELANQFKDKLPQEILQGLRTVDDNDLIATLSTMSNEFEVEPIRSYAIDVKNLLGQ